MLLRKNIGSARLIAERCLGSNAPGGQDTAETVHAWVEYRPWALNFVDSARMELHVLAVSVTLRGRLLLKQSEGGLFMKFSLVPAMVAGVFIAGAAQAATMTQTVSDSFSSAPAMFGFFNDELALDQFDPTLGTLTGVTIRAAASATGRDGAAGDPFDPDVARSFGAVDIWVAGFIASDRDVDTDSCNTVDCFVSVSSSAAASVFEVLGTSDDLSAFIGIGTVDNFFQADAGGRNGTSVSVSGTLTYTYETAAAVPLPAGAPLLLAGLGAFAIARRRAKT